MKAKHVEVIQRIWNEIEAIDPDASTEMLFALTAERASRELHTEIDDGDVAEALSQSPNAYPPS